MRCETRCLHALNVGKLLGSRRTGASLFRDENGFTTTSMVISLLITLALLFTAAQVYRVNSASAEVQDVADAAALSAETQVAEFMVVARFCDAVVLSLSFTGIGAYGLGVAALCTPATAPASEKLIEAGMQAFKARDQFADRAKAVLTKLQEALPFFAAACAAGVSMENNANSSGSSYVGLALLVPGKGEPITSDVDDGSDAFADDVNEQADDIRQKAEDAEEASKGANEAKQRAFEHDCGAATGYCMYERAASLAGLSSWENPLYSSIDTWTFSVALERARNYYSKRSVYDEPDGSAPADLTRWYMRLAFYDYAADLLYYEGYVYEDDDSFEANFPLLPKNTGEMMGTRLYTDNVYPISEEHEENGGDEEGEGGEGGERETRLVMHSYEGCPGATGNVVMYGSLQYMDAANLEMCPECELRASSMGLVAAASSAIENGFEYHYSIVAQAAEDYETERRKADAQKAAVKERVSGLLEKLKEILQETAGKRIEVSPPGAYGAIAFVVNKGTMSVSAGMASGFVSVSGSLGPRAAVSASTLIDEGSDEGRTVISSLLDGVRPNGGVLVGVAGIVLDVWSRALSAYSDGIEALTGGIEQGLNQLPLVGESGLGTWAKDAVMGVLSGVGLQPAKIEVLKPVLVNSAHVAAKDDAGFGASLVSIKTRVVAHPLYSTDLFSAILSEAERQAIKQVEGLGDSVEIASIELLGEEGPSIPITIPLPEQLRTFGVNSIRGFFDQIQSFYVEVTGVRIWE